MDALFCPKCGCSLRVKEIYQQLRAFCSDCGYIHYEQLKVGAGAIIEKDGKLLLLQRTEEPFKLHWNLPAGYVDICESPIQAVHREVQEESGLKVEVIGIDDIYFFNDDPRGNGILIVYKCQAIAGRLSESSEGTNPTYFAPDQIPDQLAGGGHNQAIRSWQKKLPPNKLPG